MTTAPDRIVVYTRDDSSKVSIEENPLKRPRLDDTPVQPSASQRVQQLLQQQMQHQQTLVSPMAMLLHVDSQMAVLQNAKEGILRKLDNTLALKWRELEDSAETKAYMTYRAIKKEDWTCGICTRDFTPMKIADRDTVDHDYVYRCEQCASPTCWKCLFMCIEYNAMSHTHRSIGVPCPFCQTYNCNRVKETTMVGKTQTSLPFPSGYSSVDPHKAKGVKLPTSAAVLYGNTQHERNRASQAKMYDLHQYGRDDSSTTSSEESSED